MIKERARSYYLRQDGSIKMDTVCLSAGLFVCSLAELHKNYWMEPDKNKKVYVYLWHKPLNFLLNLNNNLEDMLLYSTLWNCRQRRRFSASHCLVINDFIRLYLWTLTRVQFYTVHIAHRRERHKSKIMVFEFANTTIR